MFPYAIHVGGKNSNYFYAGLVHPRLRTLCCRGSWQINRLHSAPDYRAPIPSQELRLLQNPVAVTQYLRVATDALQKSGGVQPAEPESFSELSHEQNSDELRRSVAKMTDLRIVEHDEFDVYFAPYERLGPVMVQIAIAREKTFREVGEGTGLSQDSDGLIRVIGTFLWDKTECHRRSLSGWSG